MTTEDGTPNCSECNYCGGDMCTVCKEQAWAAFAEKLNSPTEE